MKNLNEEIKTKITRIIHALIPEANIYLFGSRASGKHSAHSDIDIALDTGKPLDPIAVLEVHDMLNASNIPYSFDIVDVQSIGQELKQKIYNEGIIWLKVS